VVPGQRPILRALIHLCVPMAAAEVVTSIYSVVNAGFIGSLHDTVLLAAITFGTPMFSLVLAVGGVFGIGGGAYISRLLGESEDDPTKTSVIKNVSAFALWGSVIGGSVAGVVGLVLIHPLVDALGADASARHATSTYVTVLLAFVPVLAASFCLEQLVRAEGASKQAMIGLICSAVGNVGFDVVFILVLHWGVAGAALATGLTNVVSAAYFAAWLSRHSAHMSLSPRWFTLATTTLRPVFGVGMSVLLQAVLTTSHYERSPGGLDIGGRAVLGNDPVSADRCGQALNSACGERGR
jgi:multidrug efflux pump